MIFFLVGYCHNEGLSAAGSKLRRGAAVAAATPHDGDDDGGARRVWYLEFPHSVASGPMRSLKLRLFNCVTRTRLAVASLLCYLFDSTGSSPPCARCGIKKKKKRSQSLHTQVRQRVAAREPVLVLRPEADGDGDEGGDNNVGGGRPMTCELKTQNQYVKEKGFCFRATSCGG